MELRCVLSAAFACTLLWPAAASGSPATDPADILGEYVLPDGGRVSVLAEGPIPDLVRLGVIDWSTGRIGRLQEQGDDRYVAPAADPGRPDDGLAVAFGRGADGRITHLLLTRGQDGPVRAERVVTFSETPVSYPSGGAVLSGTLKVPLGPGPFPAVVLIHGSGPGVREQTETMARFFCRLGLAVLSYDKRGCGASTGDWKTVDLDTLAGDALTGVAWLRSRAGIDPGRVGLWGISQGGWIAPLAAGRAAEVAFVINHSGPGVSPRRQDTFMAESVLRMQEIPAPDIALALDVLNVLYDYGRGRAPAAALDAAIARTRGRPGLEDLAEMAPERIVPDSLYARQAVGDPAWFVHIDPDHDALGPYRELRCPLLVIYGRLDYTVPVPESAAAIGAALAASGHPDYRVEVLDRTGHGPLVMDPQAPERPLPPPTLAAEYFDLIGAWLAERGLRAPGD